MRIGDFFVAILMWRGAMIACVLVLACNASSEARADVPISTRPSTEPARGASIFSEVSGRHIDKVKALIAKDRSIVNARDAEQKTPLIFLVNTTRLTLSAPGPGFQGKLEDTTKVDSVDTDLATVLLDAGADINARDKFDRNALLTAIVDGKPKLARLLIEKGADVNVVMSDQKVTSLHAAVGHGEAEIIELLVRKGANVNVQDADGNAPLHIAALYDWKEPARVLLKLGADRTLRNKAGQTPLDAAREKKNSDIEQLLTAASQRK